MKIDKIYQKPLIKNSKFIFDRKVASVFENMIHRSVPNYQFVVEMTGEISKNFLKEGSNYYDLGSSLGATTYSVIQNNLSRNISFNVFSIDNSQAMIAAAKKNFKKLDLWLPANINLDFICEDILKLNFQNASFLTSNFTLQFIPAEKRGDFLAKIYKAMLPGACLILSEKIKADNEEEDIYLEDLQVSFKNKNGYSNLEISQKRTALENVLIREKMGFYESIFREIGFSRTYRWFQSFNFVSFVLIK